MIVRSLSDKETRKSGHSTERSSSGTLTFQYGTSPPLIFLVLWGSDRAKGWKRGVQRSQGNTANFADYVSSTGVGDRECVRDVLLCCTMLLLCTHVESNHDPNKSGRSGSFRNTSATTCEARWTAGPQPQNTCPGYRNLIWWDWLAVKVLNDVE